MQFPKEQKPVLAWPKTLRLVIEETRKGKQVVGTDRGLRKILAKIRKERKGARKRVNPQIFSLNSYYKLSFDYYTEYDKD